MKRFERHSRYIWQRSEWHGFRWDSETLPEPLRRLSRKHDLLNGRMSMLGFDEDLARYYSMSAEINRNKKVAYVSPKECFATAVKEEEAPITCCRNNSAT